ECPFEWTAPANETPNGRGQPSERHAKPDRLHTSSPSPLSSRKGWRISQARDRSALAVSSCSVSGLGRSDTKIAGTSNQNTWEASVRSPVGTVTKHDENRGVQHLV